MEVFDGHTPPKPTGLLELEEQAALQDAVPETVPLAVELDELSRKQVCVLAIDKFLRQRNRARADLERAGDGTLLETGAKLDLALTERKLSMVAGVAGEVIVHQATQVLKRAA